MSFVSLTGIDIPAVATTSKSLISANESSAILKKPDPDWTLTVEPPASETMPPSTAPADLNSLNPVTLSSHDWSKPFDQLQPLQIQTFQMLLLNLVSL